MKTDLDRPAKREIVNFARLTWAAGRRRPEWLTDERRTRSQRPSPLTDGLVLRLMP